LNNLVQYVSRKKTRLIVKKGLESISLRLEDIVLFFTENKIVYVVDQWGKKYLIDRNLGELEEDLDNNIFLELAYTTFFSKLTPYIRAYSKSRQVGQKTLIFENRSAAYLSM